MTQEKRRQSIKGYVVVNGPDLCLHRVERETHVFVLVGMQSESHPNLSRLQCSRIYCLSAHIRFLTGSRLEDSPPVVTLGPGTYPPPIAGIRSANSPPSAKPSLAFASGRTARHPNVRVTFGVAAPTLGPVGNRGQQLTTAAPGVKPMRNVWE